MLLGHCCSIDTLFVVYCWIATNTVIIKKQNINLYYIFSVKWWNYSDVQPLLTVKFFILVDFCIGWMMFHWLFTIRYVLDTFITISSLRSLMMNWKKNSKIEWHILALKSGSGIKTLWTTLKLRLFCGIKTMVDEFNIRL